MSHYKNHGNRPQVRGFRPGRIPTQVQTETPITTKLGVNVGLQRVVIEYDRPVQNMMMTIEQVDELIGNLTKSRTVLLDELSKRAAKNGAKQA